VERIEINNIEVFIDKGENYIQINDITGENLAKVWAPLREQYPGYEVNICYRDMPQPKEALAAIGATVLEDCIKYEIFRLDHRKDTSFITSAIAGLAITLLDKSDFKEIAEMHDKLNPNIFWTSRLVLQHWDKWRILGYRTDGKITGYIMLHVSLRDRSMGEIFCIVADSQDGRKGLLAAAVKCAFVNDKTVTIFMVDKLGCNSAYEQEAAIAIRFKETGYYVGYEARL